MSSAHVGIRHRAVFDRDGVAGDARLDRAEAGPTLHRGAQFVVRQSDRPTQFAVVAPQILAAVPDRHGQNGQFDQPVGTDRREHQALPELLESTQRFRSVGQRPEQRGIGPVGGIDVGNPGHQLSSFD